MLILAAGLILFGGLWAFIGLKLFRLLLPIAGLISGAIIGFSGVQAIFGVGVVSTTVAIIVAIVVGLVLALLSYFLYEVAIVVLAAAVGASLFTHLGIAVGLEDNGFLLFLLGASGAIMGLMFSLQSGFSVGFVMVLTSLLGIGYIFAGIMLGVGEITIDQLSEVGIINSVVETVDQSFLWLLAWIGGTLVAVNMQKAALTKEFAENRYEYVPNDK